MVGNFSLIQAETTISMTWDYPLVEGEEIRIELDIMGSTDSFPLPGGDCNGDDLKCHGQLILVLDEFFSEEVPETCDLDSPLSVGAIKCHGNTCWVKKENEMVVLPDIPDTVSGCSLSNVCTGHGQCGASTGRCECVSGWDGLSCNVAVADMMSWCPGGFANTTQCVPCEIDQYTGDCARTCTIVDTCNGHGRCKGRTGSCKCYPGWQGEFCDVKCPSGQLNVSLKMQNLCLETGLQAHAAITVIGRPSQLHVDEIEQSQTMWNLQWTRPDRFWSESAALPADYLLALDCGESKMEIVYNDSASVARPSFVSVLNAQWEYVDSSRAVTLSAEGSEGILALPVPLTCRQGDEIAISVTARNRVFNSPVTTIRQRVIAPPSEVVGLRSEEYPGGITLFWKQVRILPCVYLISLVGLQSAHPFALVVWLDTD